MADLSEIQVAQSVKIIGSSSVGVESTPVDSTLNGALKVNLNDSGGTELLGRRTDSGSIPSTIAESPTFGLLSLTTAIGNGKSMISLLNGSGSGASIRIKSIKIINVQTTAVTGVIAQFQLLRFTGHSAGTSLTPLPYHTSDSLNGSITAMTGGTITGEAANPLKRWYWSSDEWGTGTLDQEGLDHAFQTLLVHYEHKLGMRPITIVAGEGIHIKQITNSIVGSYDLEIEFTQE